MAGRADFLECCDLFDFGGVAVLGDVLVGMVTDCGLPMAMMLCSHVCSSVLDGDSRSKKQGIDQPAVNVLATNNNSMKDTLIFMKNIIMSLRPPVIAAVTSMKDTHYPGRWWWRDMVVAP
nr:hypothetical protein [Tanacetum cinerariifolium]